MPWVALGIGLIALFGIGAGIASARRSPQTPRGTPPPPRSLPPATTPAPTAARDAAARIEAGEASAEDYEQVAAEAERQGLADAAQALRERAAEAPEGEALEQADQAAQAATLQSEIASLTPEERQRLQAIFGRTSAQTEAEVAAMMALANGYLARNLANIAERLRSHASSLTVVPPEPSGHTPVQPPPDLPENRPPDGFNPTEARALAPTVANDVARSEYNYDRTRMRDFQRFAGLRVDGIYGGGTRGALIFYGVTTPRRPLFRPTTTSPYPESLAYWATKVEGGELTLQQALRGERGAS